CLPERRGAIKTSNPETGELRHTGTAAYAQQVQLSAGFADCIDRLQAGEDLVGFQRDHAADRDPRIADLLEFADSHGVRGRTPALRPSNWLELPPAAAASGQELAGELQCQVLPGHPVADVRVAGVPIGFGVVAEYHVIDRDAEVEAALFVKVDDLIWR